MSEKKIVVVKKKKVAEHGHHGGSWKVAYADFVTAMMAFFLVMWIMNMDQGIKDMVEGYFQNPVGFRRAYSGGKNLLSAGNFISNIEIKRTVIINRDEQERHFDEVTDQIREDLSRAGLPGELDAAVEMVVTDDGLRIELMETGDGHPFFSLASADLRPELEAVLGVVAQGLSRTDGPLIVEGHTDGLPYGGEGYSNWELSVDRANAARRVLEADGVDGDRVREVRGYADQRLKVPSDPADGRNRRITVLLPFRESRMHSLPSVTAEEFESDTEPAPGKGGPLGGMR